MTVKHNDRRGGENQSQLLKICSFCRCHKHDVSTIWTRTRAPPVLWDYSCMQDKVHDCNPCPFPTRIPPPALQVMRFRLCCNPAPLTDIDSPAASAPPRQASRASQRSTRKGWLTSEVTYCGQMSRTYVHPKMVFMYLVSIKQNFMNITDTAVSIAIKSLRPETYLNVIGLYGLSIQATLYVAILMEK